MHRARIGQYLLDPNKVGGIDHDSRFKTAAAVPLAISATASPAIVRFVRSRREKLESPSSRATMARVQWTFDEGEAHPLSFCSFSAGEVTLPDNVVNQASFCVPVLGCRAQSDKPVVAPQEDTADSKATVVAEAAIHQQECWDICSVSTAIPCAGGALLSAAIFVPGRGLLPQL